MAFIAANLDAVEIIGMSANGVNYGIPTVHYFWVGAEAVDEAEAER